MLASHATFTSALPIVTLPLGHFLQVFAGNKERRKTHTQKSLTEELTLLKEIVTDHISPHKSVLSQDPPLCNF